MITETGPLIGPSANVSGQESGKEFTKLLSQFSEKLEGVADDQALTGIDSTILDLSGDKAKILRQGSISREEIKAAVPEIEFED